VIAARIIAALAMDLTLLIIILNSMTSRKQQRPQSRLN
jgi:hypothetical protein